MDDGLSVVPDIGSSLFEGEFTRVASELCDGDTVRESVRPLINVRVCVVSHGEVLLA